MRISPSTHFVSFAQSITTALTVWPQFLFVAIVGGLFFLLAILRFRSTAA
jgi:ABC-2 type transport system permease protein